jgi:hypothetical protein
MDSSRQESPPEMDTTVPHSARVCRAVRHLAGEAGVREFLDIGTGLPTMDDTHEVAQRVAPGSRIVYDPLVLPHANALLTASTDGWNEQATDTITPRTHAEVSRFFDGLEPLEPGLVSMSRRRVEATPWGEPAEVSGFCGVGRKP